jgi:hypothetical protein
MKTIAGVALGLALGAITVAGPARAADGQVGGRTLPADLAPGEPSVLVPRERPTRRSFYGWEILAFGESGALLAAGSVLLPDKPLGSVPATIGFVVGMPVYALGGPVVHWQHGEFHKGLIAFGGNVAFPLIGGFVGRGVRCGESNAPIDCGSRGFLAGFAIGALIAPVVDAIALGWEDIPLEDVVTGGDIEHRRRRPTPSTAFSISPTWSIGPRGSVELGVVGSF